MVRPPKPTPPKGELSEMEKDPLSVKLEVDSFDGKIHVSGSLKHRSPQWDSFLFLYSF
ncbi:hypothetical protein [Endozoicomonas euniceicola]|uniref:BON domain-containing protein n=1 Tax=Endozoicomonas euniceicola TaxID=1234143 RepID=A0ABY6GQT4_9GAMM|nr:hypothetical protein [Endozoicomonas euniceicola]UYM15108.1 hypothetical protein NX720_19905 [Endozoicomonas euniceicola]